MGLTQESVHRIAAWIAMKLLLTDLRSASSLPNSFSHFHYSIWSLKWGLDTSVVRLNFICFSEVCVCAHACTCVIHANKAFYNVQILCMLYFPLSQRLAKNNFELAETTHLMLIELLYFGSQNRNLGCEYFIIKKSMYQRHWDIFICSLFIKNHNKKK